MKRLTKHKYITALVADLLENGQLAQSLSQSSDGEGTCLTFMDVLGGGGCGPVEGEDDEVVSDSVGRDCVIDIVGDGVTSCVCRVCEGVGIIECELLIDARTVEGGVVVEGSSEIGYVKYIMDGEFYVKMWSVAPLSTTHMKYDLVILEAMNECILAIELKE
ncbi:hypothetical protein Tco_1099049 [Tanacetum coccineum]